MRAHGGSTDPAALRRLWGCWTEVVELYARQLPRRGRVDPRSYRALHQQLLATCRTLAETDANGRRDYYEDLCYLAQPWLTPWILQQTDREILLDLLERCQNVQTKFGGRRLARLARPLLVVAALTACAGLAALGVWYFQPRWTPLYERLDDNWRLFVLAAKRLTNLEWTFAIGGAAILFAMVVVWRTGWRR